jgi:hypothetical protein
LQTPNAKPLDTSFGAFWQITQMQTSNAKPLEMLLYIRCVDVLMRSPTKLNFSFDFLVIYYDFLKIQRK